MAIPLQVSLDGTSVDVAIIGAGINGASAAQHLSAAGYSVLVVDQGDFADGATSRSSRLLHCGLRHLADGSGLGGMLLQPNRIAWSIKATRDDMIARDELVRSIPHRVKPFNFCIPIHAGGPYGPWQLDTAFAFLRAMSPRGIPLDYRRYGPGQFAEVPISPWLPDAGQLRGLAVFREYRYDWAERIALDALFDARRMGARVHNYTRLTALERLEPEQGWQLTLQDTGATGESGQTSRVQAAMVLNLAGAWVDAINREAGASTEAKCAPTKGVHIAVRLPDEFTDWGLFAFNSLAEPLYCLPAAGMHYVGLTRTPFDGDAAGVSATDEEIDWLISETNRCLPKLAITRSDILFTWAGVNPLTRDPREPRGSREIKIHDLSADGLPGVLSLTGGPIMTHRRVAQRLVRAVSRRLSPSGPSQQADYASGACEPEPNAPRVVGEVSSVSKADVEHCARHEMPGSLADLLMRRLGAGWACDQGIGLAEPVAQHVAPILGWTSERVRQEVEAYASLLSSARRRPGQDPG